MTKPTYEELERALDIMTEKYKAEYGYVESAREERDQIAKTCDLLRAENLRVRGLLQRQWISVEERLPEYREVVQVWLEGRRTGVPRFGTGQRLRTDESGDVWQCYWINHVYEHGEVTHWMPLPDPPTFPQSSSLVSQGAESADIGKLDTADEDENVLCAFCPTRSPDGSMKACIDAGKCLHPDKPVGHFSLAAASSTNCTTCRRQILTASTAVASGMMPKLHEYFCTCTRAGSAETGGEKAIDEQFKGMATDEKYQAETLKIEKEFAQSDWEALLVSEDWLQFRRDPDNGAGLHAVFIDGTPIHHFKSHQRPAPYIQRVRDAVKRVAVALAESSLSSPPPTLKEWVDAIRCQKCGAPLDKETGPTHVCAASPELLPTQPDPKKSPK